MAKEYAKGRWANINFGEVVPGDADLSAKIGDLMEKRSAARKALIVDAGLADGEGNVATSPEHVVLSRFGFVVDTGLSKAGGSSGRVRYDAEAIAARLGRGANKGRRR